MRKFYTPEAVTEDHAEPGPRGKHLPFRCQTTAFTGVKVFESAGNPGCCFGLLSADWNPLCERSLSQRCFVGLDGQEHADSKSIAPFYVL